MSRTLRMAFAAAGASAAMLLATAGEAQSPPVEARPDPNAPASTNPADPEAQSVEVQPLPPSAYAVGERPPAKDKVFDAKPAKVWAAILKALADADVPVESSDEAAGSIQTRLISFDHTRFYDVATKPPLMTPERPIWQVLRLNQGWFSAEIHMTKDKAGTSVGVRAYIEELGRDVVSLRKLHVERFSNGRIEDYFFAKFAESLK